MAHQIAYLDIVSNGRYTTIGLGRGVAKSEFDAVGVPREESRQRFNETLDILKLAFTQERFSYDGEIFKIPEMSLRPAPISRDLFSRIYGSSATPDSLEILSRRGMVPLFVGNKPIEEAGKEVQQVNTFRHEEGLRAVPAEERAVHVLHAHPAGCGRCRSLDHAGQRGRQSALRVCRLVEFQGRQGLRGLRGARSRGHGAARFRRDGRRAEGCEAEDSRLSPVQSA